MSDILEYIEESLRYSIANAFSDDEPACVTDLADQLEKLKNEERKHFRPRHDEINEMHRKFVLENPDKDKLLSGAHKKADELDKEKFDWWYERARPIFKRFGERLSREIELDL